MRTAKFTITFTLALSENLYNIIKNQSDKEGVSMAELVREVLDERFMKQNQKANSLTTKHENKS